METTEKNTFKWIVIASLICIGLAVLIYFPYLVPAVTVIIWLKFRGSIAMVPYFLFLGLTFFIGEVFSAVLLSFGFASAGFTMLYTVLFVCLTFPPAIVSVLPHRSGRRMYESVLQTILASFFGVGAFVALVYIFTEQNLTTLIINALTHILKADSDFLSLNYSLATSLTQMISGTTAVATSVTDAQKVAYLVELYEEVLPAYLGTLVVSNGLLSGFFSYYLPYVFLKNKNVEMTPCPAFKDLRIPKPEWIVLIVIYLAASFVSLTSAYSLQIIASVLRSAVVLVFTVQGLAFLTFLFKSKRISALFYIGLIILGLLFNVLFWLGLLEAVMNMRTRIDTLEKSGGE